MKRSAPKTVLVIQCLRNRGKILILQQSGASVTGNAASTGGASSVSGPVTGTVSGDECSISYKGGIAHLTVKGNEMSGSSSLSRWTLKRQ